MKIDLEEFNEIASDYNLELIINPDDIAMFEGDLSDFNTEYLIMRDYKHVGSVLFDELSDDETSLIIQNIKFLMIKGGLGTDFLGIARDYCYTKNLERIILDKPDEAVTNELTVSGEIIQLTKSDRVAMYHCIAKKLYLESNYDEEENQVIYMIE